MFNLQDKARLFLGLDFLTRLRRALIIFSLLFFALWLLIFLLFPKVFPWLLYPYYQLVGSKPLVFITIEEALFVAIKASFYLTLIPTLPILLVKLWSLISDELYDYEVKFLKRLVVLSLLLSFLGFLFGYFLLFPMIVKIFLYFGENFENTLRVSGFLFFMLKVLLFSVLSLQMPLLLALLIREGIISYETYRQRRFLILSILFGLAFIIAPADFFSQVLLTLFFFLFFKLSFLISKLL